MGHDPAYADSVPLPIFKIATWNVWWQSATSPRGRAIRRILEQRNADVIVITEAAGVLMDGHVISSDPDYGYRIVGTRRKVLLWSRTPWRDADNIGHPDLPCGRFVAGTTDTPLGPVRIIGVCIPWKDAHVSTGRRNRCAWDNHVKYIEALKNVLTSTTGPTIVAGDFNQTIVAGNVNEAVPRSRAPLRASEALRRTFEPLGIATAGQLPPLGRLAIDHVAHTPDLVATGVDSWPQYDGDGCKLSDHFGVEVTFTTAS